MKKITIDYKANQTYKSELKKALQEANIYIMVEYLIGRQYCIGCSRRHGSHSYTLVGTITGIYLSDEAGLRLELSSKEIAGEKIKGITWIENRWAVEVDQEKLTEEQSEKMSENQIHDFLGERFYFVEFFEI